MMQHKPFNQVELTLIKSFFSLMSMKLNPISVETLTKEQQTTLLELSQKIQDVK